jgi:hypothetical protein
MLNWFLLCLIEISPKFLRFLVKTLPSLLTSLLTHFPSLPKVKVTWAKLFPEEVQEEENQETEEEVFPTSIAFPPEINKRSVNNTWNFGEDKSADQGGGGSMADESDSAAVPSVSGSNKPGQLAGDGEDMVLASGELGGNNNKKDLIGDTGNGTRPHSSSLSISRKQSLGKLAKSASMSGAMNNTNNVNTALGTRGMNLLGSSAPPSVGVTHVPPLSRTALAKPPNRPGGPQILPRQKGEPMNAKYISPLVQQFLLSGKKN